MADKLTKEDVLKIVEDKQIKFIRFWFTDVLGILKSFAITPAELEGAFEEGMGFDGSSIEGFARIQESDMVAWPDPSTFTLLPWRAGARRHRPHVLRHPAARRRARSRATHATCSSKVVGQGRGPGLHVQRRPRARVLLLQGQPRHRGARPRRLLRPDHRSTPAATCAATPSTPCRPWASRSSTPTTRWPRPSTRSICATRTR